MRKSIKRFMLISFSFMLMFPFVAAANTICVNWGVSNGTKAPDFDLTLVMGQTRVLYPPQNTVLKIGANIAALHEKSMKKGEECITLVDEEGLKNHLIGIHHYGGDATNLQFLKLFKRPKNGNIELIGNYEKHFARNTAGNMNAVPSSNSNFWVLVPVTKVSTKKQPVVASTPEVKKKEKSCAPGQRADLRHCNFDGKNLEGADFRNANVNGVSFKSANLKKALFNDAECRSADFSHADLYDASFTRAKCEKANFNKASLRKVNFKDAFLKRAKFRKADIRDANFKRADLRKSSIKEAGRDEGANFEDVQR